MDAKTLELIAIGASVASHCQPCLSYHVAAARSLGADDTQISEAIAVGRQVEKGATAAMRKFTENISDLPALEAPSCCCSGNTAQGGKDCC